VSGETARGKKYCHWRRGGTSSFWQKTISPKTGKGKKKSSIGANCRAHHKGAWGKGEKGFSGRERTFRMGEIPFWKKSDSEISGKKRGGMSSGRQSAPRVMKRDRSKKKGRYTLLPWCQTRKKATSGRKGKVSAWKEAHKRGWGGVLGTYLSLKTKTLQKKKRDRYVKGGGGVPPFCTGGLFREKEKPTATGGGDPS